MPRVHVERVSLCCTVVAKSIGSDIHFVFAKFAASVVVMLINFVIQLLCSD